MLNQEEIAGNLDLKPLIARGGILQVRCGFSVMMDVWSWKVDWVFGQGDWLYFLTQPLPGFYWNNEKSSQLPNAKNTTVIPNLTAAALSCRKRVNSFDVVP